MPSRYPAESDTPGARRVPAAAATISGMDVETVRALRTPLGAQLLARACEEYDGTGDAPLLLATRLRAEHPEAPAALVSAALTQARLRARAVAKLGPSAAALLLTADGLEQATRRTVADHRAARIRASLGEGARVADLCCGVGGDLVALAAAGLDVTGVDRDPLAAEAARANLAALGLPGRVVEADVESVDRSDFDACVADPARRASTDRGGARVTDPATWSPPWSWVADALTGTACVKVAPGIAHELVPAGVEAEWVSDGGDVVEAALWSGRLAEPAGGARVRRRATLLPSAVTLTDADDPGEAPVLPPEGVLYEPDGAVIRAGLVTAVAAQLDGGLLDPRIAYVVASHFRPTPYARAYEIVDVLPFSEKRLRTLVRDRRIGRLTVKKRGVGIDPAELRRRLRPTGDGEATLVVTRVASARREAGEAVALLVEPVG